MNSNDEQSPPPLSEESPAEAPSVVVGVEEKRWVASDSGCILFDEKGKQLAIWGDTPFKEIADAHNASLGEPRGEFAAEHVLQNAGLLETVIRIARGCHDYGGGYRDERADAFQHGIKTVVTALEAFAKNGLGDTQVFALYKMGAPTATRVSDEEIARETAMSVLNLCAVGIINAEPTAHYRTKVPELIRTAIRKSKSPFSAWIKTSERLPTEADARDGEVFAKFERWGHSCVKYHLLADNIDALPYWMPIPSLSEPKEL